MIERRAWLVWGVGVLAYVVAVLQRTSLGVSGLIAVDRFHTSAGALATFLVVQLLVYASLQVPVGMLLDRYGARLLVTVGAVVMSVGQALLAVADGLGEAIGARVLVGAGDAMTFICVLRLVSAWFPARRVPLLTQLTGILGQLGQALSAIPLVALLHGPGWTPAYVLAAATSVLVAVLCLAVLRDSPAGHRGRDQAPGAVQVLRWLVAAWRHPGTRLGFYTSFTMQFSGTAFALLWGYPFLVSGEGLSPAVASTLLTVFVVSGMVAGPILGELVARHPRRRSWLVLAIAAMMALAWTVVLVLPFRAPLWLLVMFVLVLAVGGPGAIIGFDYARTFNPSYRQGAAIGIVNVGGFVSSLVTVLLVGLVLDALTPGASTDYGLDAFRVAWLAQLPIGVVGVLGILRNRREVRAVRAARAREAREALTI